MVDFCSSYNPCEVSYLILRKAEVWIGGSPLTQQILLGKGASFRLVSLESQPEVNPLLRHRGSVDYSLRGGGGCRGARWSQ